MTYDGFCTVALAGTFVMLIAVSVGWWIDRHAALRQAWRDYRRNGREIRRVRAARSEAMRRIAIGLDIDPRVLRRFDAVEGAYDYDPGDDMAVWLVPKAAI